MECTLCKCEIPEPNTVFKFIGYEGPCPRPHWGAEAGFCTYGWDTEDVKTWMQSFAAWQAGCPALVQWRLMMLEGLIERLEQKGFARTDEDVFVLQELARQVYDKLRPAMSAQEVVWINKWPRDPTPPEGPFFRDWHKRTAARKLPPVVIAK